MLFSQVRQAYTSAGQVIKLRGKFSCHGNDGLLRVVNFRRLVRVMVVGPLS